MEFVINLPRCVQDGKLFSKNIMISEEKTGKAVMAQKESGFKNILTTWIKMEDVTGT